MAGVHLGPDPELVEGLAAGLMALGVELEDRVALLASTRYEWVLAFLATQVAGAAVTPLDPAPPTTTLARALAESGARVVIAEDYDAVRRCGGSGPGSAT